MRKTKDSFKKFVARTRSFLTAGVWDAELGALPRMRARAVGAVRVLLMVIRGFEKHESGIRAASLTFFTLLSFIPVLALALSVVKIVGYDDTLRETAKDSVRMLLADGHSSAVTNTISEAVIPVENSVVELPVNDTEIPDDTPDEGFTLVKIEKLIDDGFDAVGEIDFKKLGGIGLAFFIWTIIAVLGSVELAFNKVWGVHENRSLARKFTDYLSVIIICPVLLAAASSLPALAIAKEKMAAADAAIPFFGIPIVRVAWVIFLLTLAFTFMLRFTPNTKVRWMPGLAGGFVTAIGFAAWLKICLAMQIGVVKYNAIFGGFSMLPILLSWVYVSWEIILFGAEFSYALQNVDSYPREQGWRQASWKARILLAASLMREAVAKISGGATGATSDGILRLREFNAARRISARLVREVAYDLEKTGFLTEIAGEADAYALRRDPSELTFGDIASRLLDTGISPAALGVSFLPESNAATRLLDDAFGATLGVKIKDLPMEG